MSNITIVCTDVDDGVDEENVMMMVVMSLPQGIRPALMMTMYNYMMMMMFPPHRVFGRPP